MKFSTYQGFLSQVTTLILTPNIKFSDIPLILLDDSYGYLTVFVTTISFLLLFVLFNLNHLSFQK